MSDIVLTIDNSPIVLEIVETPTITLEIPKGLKGDKGDDGLQGEQGIQGVQGEAGQPASLANIDERIVVQLDTDGTIKAAIDIVDDALTAHKADVYNPHGVTKAQVGLSNVDNTSDTDKPISTLTQSALNAKEASITAGTTVQYWRGDKSWQTLDKAAVGLSNVANIDTTTTANITDSTDKRFVTNGNLTTIGNQSGTNTGDETQATIKTKLGAATTSADGYLTATDWTTFNSKQAALGYTAENVANKDTDGTLAANSDTKYASQKAVKTYVTAKTIRSLDYALSDQTTAIATGTPLTCRVPYSFTISSVKASLKTAQVSGSLFTLDIKKNGTSIFSTLLTFDNTEKTTATAATAAVLSTTSLSDDDELTFIVTQIGNGTAIGLVAYIIGYPT